MSRADELRAKYDAELAVIELEDKLVELKDGGDPDELRACKEELRAARQAWREMRAGDVEVSPAVVTTTATVKESGN